VVIVSRLLRLLGILFLMQRNFGSLFCVEIGDGDVDERVAELRLYCSGIGGLEDDGMLCV